MSELWSHCLSCLEHELPQQQVDTWLRVLSADADADDAQRLRLLAPNRRILTWVQKSYLPRIQELAVEHGGEQMQVELAVRAPARKPRSPAGSKAQDDTRAAPAAPNDADLLADPALQNERLYARTRLSTASSFENYVTGRANDLARAAAMQVATNPGAAYNPLFIYAGVGLGKTHLAQAIGNEVFRRNPGKAVRYIHANDYWREMVNAYQKNSFDNFQRDYRSLDLLIIDDIHFFDRKERTQDAFFDIFNALTEAKKQIIITCDTYPKDIKGLEPRLISRFDWGLTVQIEPPELEMRIAILKKKAALNGIDLDHDVAFLIAKHLRSNVRELEGALNRCSVVANFREQPISLELAREALKDLLRAHNRQLTVENIQKVVADYYAIKVADMHSKSRSRLVARPRQLAMWLAKELTPLSLPAIGEAFGGRDHSTVVHAHKTITRLRKEDEQLNHAIHVLTQTLHS